MKVHHLLLAAFILLALLTLPGCIEQTLNPPFTNSQFYARSTNLDYNTGVHGGYANQFPYFDTNGKLSSKYIFSQRYYLHMEASNVAGYESLFTYPAEDSEHSDCTVVKDSNTHQLLDIYITDVNSPNSLVIPAGTWDFKTWTSVDADLGDTWISASAYKRYTDGTEVFLFDVNSAYFDSGGVFEPDMITTQALNFDLNATDRLVVKYYANTTSPANRTVCFYYEGANYYSYIDTPILGGTGQTGGTTIITGGSGVDTNTVTAEWTDNNGTWLRDINVIKPQPQVILNRTDRNILITRLMGNYYETALNGLVFAHNKLNAVVFGTNAGTANTYATFVALGYEAGKNVNGRESTFVGYQSGVGTINGIGYQNTGLGYQTLQDINTGIANTVIGAGAGKDITTGGQNVIIGSAAPFLNTGSGNTCIGTSAGRNLLSGANNFFLGYGTGYDVNTGSNNIYIGYNAGNNAPPTALGLLAMGQNAGDYGSAFSIGNATGRYNTGQYNVFLGNTVASGIAADYTAGTTTGTRNTLVGNRNATGLNSGSYNVVVGSYAGEDLNAGERNIWLGNQAGLNQTDIDNTLLIGAWGQARAIDDLNNDIIYGKMSNSYVGQELYFNADVYLQRDNRKLVFGNDNDGNIFWDGNNFRFNSGTGLAYFDGNISTTGINYRTNVDTSTDALEYFKEGNDLMSGGVIDHEAFGECYNPVTVTDFSRPVKIKVAYEECSQPKELIPRVIKDCEFNETAKSGEFDKVCNNRTIQEWVGKEICEDVCEFEEDLINVGKFKEVCIPKCEPAKDVCVTKFRDENSYPYTTVIEQIDGGCLYAKQNQALALLNNNVDLYDGLTDFDSGVMAEAIYTESKTPVTGVDYLSKFTNSIFDKSTHKNKESKDLFLTDGAKSRTVELLNLEDRIVDLEGAILQLKNQEATQNETITLLKSELCKKDNSYKWCK